jgi:hypothetical protein
LLFLSLFWFVPVYHARIAAANGNCQSVKEGGAAAAGSTMDQDPGEGDPLLRGYIYPQRPMDTGTDRWATR